MDKIIEWISELKPENVIVIITSIVSFLTSIGVEIHTSRRTKKLEKMRIDADLVAKARIEWIQNVRETASRFIADCYTVLNSKDVTRIYEMLGEIKRQASLLCLFFGPENKEEKDSDVDLMNQNNNVGKNKVLVAYIIDLFDKIYDYARDTEFGRLQLLVNEFKSSQEEFYKNPIGKEYVGNSSDQDGNEHEEYMPIYNPDIKAEVDKKHKAIMDYLDSNKKIYGMIDTLRDYISIYLKIEWNKAKEGK